ncbi:MAG: hypothetical protein WBM50_06270 [Acidimicrobiales bacterium]
MAQDDWKEVKSKMEGLGLKLKLHLEQEEDESDDSAKPGETKAAIEDLGDKLQDAFASFSHAAQDPAVRTDLKEIGVLLRDAMINTFGEVGAQVGGSLKKAGAKTGDRFKPGTSSDDANAGAGGPVDTVDAADTVDAIDAVDPPATGPDDSAGDQPGST